MVAANYIWATVKFLVGASLMFAAYVGIMWALGALGSVLG